MSAEGHDNRAVFADMLLLLPILHVVVEIEFRTVNLLKSKAENIPRHELMKACSWGIM